MNSLVLSEQLHRKVSTSHSLLAMCRYLIGLTNSWLTFVPQACSVNLTRRADLDASWSTLHVLSVSPRQPPFGTRACNHYDFCVYRENMPAINLRNRYFFFSRHMAKPWEKITLEDPNRLPPLRVIKSSHIFRILNLRARIQSP